MVLELDEMVASHHKVSLLLQVSKNTMLKERIVKENAGGECVDLVLKCKTNTRGCEMEGEGRHGGRLVWVATTGRPVRAHCSNHHDGWGRCGGGDQGVSKVIVLLETKVVEGRSWVVVDGMGLLWVSVGKRRDGWWRGGRVRRG